MQQVSGDIEKGKEQPQEELQEEEVGVEETVPVAIASAVLTSVLQVDAEMTEEHGVEGTEKQDKPPQDCIVILHFRSSINTEHTYSRTHDSHDKAHPVGGGSMGNRPDVPPVPLIFTGNSRTGDVWAGPELVGKYGSVEAGAGRFTTACSGDHRLGMKMFQALRALYEEK